MKIFTAEQYFTELSSLIIEYTTEYRKQVVNEVMNKEEYTEEPKRFFYMLIHKTICSFEAANIFIRNFDSRRDYQPTLFVIIRAILSDFLVTEYIIRCSENEEHCKELIEGVYFDHIENVIKSINLTYRHIYQWSENETKTKIDEVKSQSRFYSSEGEPLLKVPKTSLNKLIVKIWQSTKNKEELLLHRRVYDLYGIFSKFEHLGELSFGLTHKGYDDTKIESLYLDLYDSIIFIVKHLTAYARLWKEDIMYNIKYFEQLDNKIYRMHPKLIKK